MGLHPNSRPGSSLLSGCPALKTNPLLDRGICKQGVSDVLFQQDQQWVYGPRAALRKQGQVVIHAHLTQESGWHWQIDSGNQTTPFAHWRPKDLGGAWPVTIVVHFLFVFSLSFLFKWWFISSPRWFIFLYNFFLERLFVILLVLDLKGKKWGGKRVRHEYFHLKGCVGVIILHVWLQCHKEIERR